MENSCYYILKLTFTLFLSHNSIAETTFHVNLWQLFPEKDLDYCYYKKIRILHKKYSQALLFLKINNLKTLLKIIARYVLLLCNYFKYINIDLENVIG